MSGEKYFVGKFCGDERGKRRVIELPQSRGLIPLTDGLKTTIVDRDSLTWKGDFAEYTNFQTLHNGQWPTPVEQDELRQHARNEALQNGNALGEDISGTIPTLN